MRGVGLLTQHPKQGAAADFVAGRRHNPGFHRAMMIMYVIGDISRRRGGKGAIRGATVGLPAALLVGHGAALSTPSAITFCRSLGRIMMV
jgi:hypothetical protein